MKFEEIFEEDGLYVADGFTKGSCFEISDGTLYLKTFKDKYDVLPETYPFNTYRGLFKKDYKKVYTRQSLFD